MIRFKIFNFLQELSFYGFMAILPLLFPFQAQGQSRAMTGQFPRSLTIKVMSFNIYRLPFGKRFQTILDVIEKSKADIIGLQEATGIMGRIGRHFKNDYHVHSRAQVLSRFPIRPWSPSKHSFLRSRPSPKLVAHLPNGLNLFLVNYHLQSYPYGPYQLRDGSSPQEVVETEVRIHLHPVQNHLRDLLRHRNKDLLLLGDFNTPSHFDWGRPGGVGIKRLKMLWPLSRWLQEQGLVDTYRALHPDPSTAPGHTWTPQQSPHEVHDRIDYIYFLSRQKKYQVKVIKSEIWGEQGEISDRQFPYWPSDHRALLSTLEITHQQGQLKETP